MFDLLSGLEYVVRDGRGASGMMGGESGRGGSGSECGGRGRVGGAHDGCGAEERNWKRGV